MNARPISFTTGDGLRLEGRIAIPDGARGSAALCHPHPLYGGTMSSILIPLLQRALDAAGWATIRFNYRGVGRSEGRFEKGTGEERDVVAALRALAAEGAPTPFAVIGWSFGAMVGLRGATLDERVRIYVAIAPPVSRPSLAYAGPPPERFAGWDARVLVACGTEDDISRPDDAERWIRDVSPGAELRVIEGADHYFTDRRDELLDAVTAFVTR